ncbi:hypothetical protein BU15DRAFT_65515 [Melanogaster broomeanus]|nr:hypothetical protein BU15DRAFT_65515 [Melanogaster broomeanus]
MHLASEDSVIASSLAVLSLHAELSMLKLENRTLTMENQRCEESVLRLEEELKEEKIKAKRAQSLVFTGKAPLRHLTEPSTSRLPAPNIPKIDPDLEYARRLQESFNAEHFQLLTQTDQLRLTAQRQFHCGICLDDIPEDDAVHVESCGHDLCRDCARSHICAKIDEHRFPVLCPICMADHGNSDPGTITGQLVQLLGVSEEQYETWVEMEMVQFSTLVNCRKCQNAAFVDKFDLEAADEVRCPILGCDHVWCKKCQQSIDASGPKHSCDGASELDHLMKEQGWKYCPNCKTPIQKHDGCNHFPYYDVVKDAAALHELQNWSCACCHVQRVSDDFGMCNCKAETLAPHTVTRAHNHDVVGVTSAATFFQVVHQAVLM